MKIFRNIILTLAFLFIAFVVIVFTTLEVETEQDGIPLTQEQIERNKAVEKLQKGNDDLGNAWDRLINTIKG